MTRSINIDDLFTELKDLRQRIKSLEQGGTGRVTWAKLPYNTGWQDYPGGVFQTGSYSIDPLGIVRLRGVVQRVSGTNNTIAVLPAGFRPKATECFTGLQGAPAGSQWMEFVRIDITTAGLVSLNYQYGGAYDSFAIISGISFSVF
jgi:hypothetical protein